MTHSPRELAAQKLQLRQQKESLFQDFLPVVDALDRATDHLYQTETHRNQKQQSNPAKLSLNWWQRLLQRLCFRLGINSSTQSSGLESLVETITSARQGVEMVRELMLTTLAKHEVVPIPAQGKPFNPECMRALGQQVDDSLPANMVVQEVVRGYLWQDRILREAQVIVAVPPTHS